MKTMAYLHATNDHSVSAWPNSYSDARELVLRTDAESRLHNFDDCSLNAILAGLRLLQQAQAAKKGIDETIFDIASDCGTKPILLMSGIDALCEHLNKSV